jgi:Xaa-Pro aminopeptidase
MKSMTRGRSTRHYSSELQPIGASDVPALAFDVRSRIEAIDQSRLRRDRLMKLRNQLARHDYAGALLADPTNIRYATGTRNMAQWTMHAPGRYALVLTDGPVVMFEFGTSKHASAGMESIDELRTSTPWFYFLAGPRVEEKARIWADQILDWLSLHGGSNRRLAVDRCEPWGAAMLERAGATLFDAQPPLELARAIKTPEEIQCMQLAIDVCDVGVQRMRRALQPGMTENQLWSVLHATNIAHNGEWIECRLLSSGPRTNPWFQECGNRAIEAGDLVAFDTDMVGPLGYLADISRTFVCPGKRASAEQRALYDAAQEQVLRNAELLRPGTAFRDFAARAWAVQPEFVPNRYMMLVHGAGMVDEYPVVADRADFADWGYDGIFEANMVVCVESYIGALGGGQGVKLEQQYLVTDSGARPMSRAPFVDALEA